MSLPALTHVERGVQQLFLVGGLAISVGVFYSKPVMRTVGDSIMPVSPIGAWVVVLAQSIVLFIFSSNELVSFVVGLGLPAYPLIPVSSSQAVIGAAISFFFLFFLQNVFLQQVFKEVRCELSPAVMAHLTKGGIATKSFEALAVGSEAWVEKPASPMARGANKKLGDHRDYVFRHFSEKGR